MALKKEQIISQQCYICGTFFQDKVRLGVHIARCYEDAMDRGESWHPHPDILLDEVRYSQYMLSGDRDKQFKSAEKKKIAYATQDDFANLHTQLGIKMTSSPKTASGSSSFSPSSAPKMPPVHVPTSTYQSDFNKDKKTLAPINSSPIDHVPPSAISGGGSGGERISTPRGGGGGGSPSFSSAASAAAAAGGRGMYYNVSSPSSSASAPPPAPAPPPKVTFAPPGINTLRNELASELDKVRLFMQDEKRRSAEREAVLTSLVDGASNRIDQANQRTSAQHQYQQQQYQQQYHYPSSASSSSSNNTAPLVAAAGRPSSSRNGDDETTSTPRRGVLPSRGNPLIDGNNQLAPVPTSTTFYNPHASAAPPALKIGMGGGVGGGGSATPRGRNQQEQQQQQRFIPQDEQLVVKIMGTDIGKAIHGGGFEADPNERVPCGRCGRMFAPDRVDAHEQVCVSKPAGIHRR